MHYPTQMNMKNYGILSNDFTHSLFIELTLYFDKQCLSVFVSKASDLPTPMYHTLLYDTHPCLPSIILIVRKFSGNIQELAGEVDRVIL